MRTNIFSSNGKSAKGSGFGARIGSFFDEWWAESLLGLPSLAGIFVSLYPEKIFSFAGHDIRYGNAALLFSVLCAAIGGVGVGIKKNKITKLRRTATENRETAQKYQNDTRELIQDNLRDLAKECSLNSGPRPCRPDSRISVYCHDGNSERFIPIARISGDPEFEKKGRSYYPDNQGIICKAWRNEFYKYQFNSEDGTDELWLKEQYELFAVPNDVARRFVMKSHSCVALRLEHRDTKIGVLVIESTNKDRADAKLMETVLGSSHFPPLKRALYRVNESHVRNMAKLADRE